MKLQAWTLAAALGLGLAACSQERVEAVPCAADPGLEKVAVVCGFRRPEDMALLPDLSILVAERGFPATRDPQREALPGRISRLDPRTMERAALPVEIAKLPGWGADDCRPAAGMAPLGMDLKPMPEGGGWRLAVVNHAHSPEEPGAQGVDLYEVIGSPQGWKLLWRGCARPPGAYFLNDVAWDGGGGFFVTRMFDRSRGGLLRALAVLLGMETGELLHYHPGEGFVAVPNSGGTLPNGVVAGPGASHLYVNYAGGGEVRVIEAGGDFEVLGAVEVRQPDNGTWAAGRLWIASQRWQLGASGACGGVRSACPLPFAIVAVDGDSLQAEEILEVELRHFGAASVVLPRHGPRGGTEVWVGSFEGDRVMRIDLDRLPWRGG